MIKIETNKIKNWSSIIDEHKDYFDTVVKVSLENIINDKFGYFKQYLSQSELDIYTHFYNNLDIIAVGSLENIFKSVSTLSRLQMSTKLHSFYSSDFEKLSKKKGNAKELEKIFRKYKIKYSGFTTSEKYERLEELSIFTKYHKEFGLLPYIFNYDSSIRTTTAAPTSTWRPARSPCTPRARTWARPRSPWPWPTRARSPRSPFPPRISWTSWAISPPGRCCSP